MVAMRVSVSAEKHLMMEEEMEFLTDVQVWAGLGSLLQVLQHLRLRNKADVPLERLWECSRRLMMRSEYTLTSVVMVRLMDEEGKEPERRDVHSLIGQELSGLGRKLPCNRKSDLICAQVKPALVSRLAGLRGTGHQNQLLGLEVAVISMILVP